MRPKINKNRRKKEEKHNQGYRGKVYHSPEETGPERKANSKEPYNQILERGKKNPQENTKNDHSTLPPRRAGGEILAGGSGAPPGMQRDETERKIERTRTERKPRGRCKKRQRGERKFQEERTRRGAATREGKRKEEGGSLGEGRYNHCVVT